MPDTIDLLGDTVMSHSGGEVAVNTLCVDGQILGLYFSAQWCPPCRGFTPKLAEFYKKFKETERGKSLEIVFVSSDKDEDEFTLYMKEMPWLALPYNDRERKAKLSKKFKIQGIPALVFIEGHSGKLITAEGRNNVLDDPEGKDFPWYPQPVSELLKGPLKSHMGDVEADKVLSGTVKGLYFSAHWCPPCRGFTPDLAKTYRKVRDAGKNFEIIYVTSDRSEESFNDYTSSMPWLALPYGDPRNTAVTKHFGVQGIPTLILLDENNRLITTCGRGYVTKDPEGKEFPWYPKPLDELSDLTASTLNECACLIYFTDGEEVQVVKAKEVMRDIACKYVEEHRLNHDTSTELPELAFFFEGLEDSEVVDSVRDFVLLEDRCPLVVIIDIPEQRMFVCKETNITAETIQTLVTDFKYDRLEFQPLRR